MSRSVCSKITVQGQLTALTPIAVGGAGAAEGADLELAVNGEGRYYIPGTSLMGPIRHWLEKNVKDGAKLVNAMLGYQDDNSDKGHASYFFIEDAAIDAKFVKEIRDGIQIHRATGTTRERMMYTRAILPRGTIVPLNAELELPEKSISGFTALDFEYALKFVLDEWLEKRPEIKLGAGKTRGFGIVKLEGDPNVNIYRFDDVKALFQYIQKKSTQCNDFAKQGKTLELSIEKQLYVTIKWEPSSPVMVKAGREGLDIDMLPLVSGIGDEKVAPVIPGSAIKGVLRSQAAKILRTVLKISDLKLENDKDPNPDNDLTSEQIDILDVMFGGKDRKKILHAGLLSVSDVYQIDNDIDAEKWLEEDKAEIAGAVVPEDHVSIDRFTGGAADSALFNIAPPKRKPNSWEAIHLTMRIPENDEDISPTKVNAGIALLWLVLRDLKEGLVTIGFGGNRGLGEIKITEDIEFKFNEGEFNLEEIKEAWKEFLAKGGKL